MFKLNGPVIRNVVLGAALGLTGGACQGPDPSTDTPTCRDLTAACRPARRGPRVPADRDHRQRGNHRRRRDRDLRRGWNHRRRRNRASPARTGRGGAAGQPEQRAPQEPPAPQEPALPGALARPEPPAPPESRARQEPPAPRDVAGRQAPPEPRARRTAVVAQVAARARAAPPERVCPTAAYLRPPLRSRFSRNVSPTWRRTRSR